MQAALVSTDSTDIKRGLEGVIVNTTSVSHVDGEAGRLYYRGVKVESLIQHSFTAVAHFIVLGKLPTAEEQGRFDEYLWVAGQLPPAIADVVVQLAKTTAHPMEILQAVTPLLANDKVEMNCGTTKEEEEGLLVAARLPTVIGAIHATRQQRPPAYPSSRRYGRRYLQMLTGHEPSDLAVDVFEKTQILQLDHSFNASTFTARVVTSTLAPPASALSAALGALYGPLHGRADQAALEMAEAIGGASHAQRYVEDCIASRKLVMGMGHREYRVVDPRARVIRELAEKIATNPEHRRLLETLVAVEKAFVEQTAVRSRAMRANLEFYKGVVYAALGIPKDCFTASFAASRVFGWLTHVVEQRQDNRIIRPAAHYIGPLPAP